MANTPHAQTAFDRLHAHSDERIRACIAQARSQDASIAPYQAGEFTRAPRGLTLALEADIGPPALEPEASAR